jgi:hypothetical protein
VQHSSETSRDHRGPKNRDYRGDNKLPHFVSIGAVLGEIATRRAFAPAGLACTPSSALVARVGFAGSGCEWVNNKKSPSARRLRPLS